MSDFDKKTHSAQVTVALAVKFEDDGKTELMDQAHYAAKALLLGHEIIDVTVHEIEATP